MKATILSLLLLIVGCNPTMSYTYPQADLLMAEGFIACSVANHASVKKMDEAKAIEEAKAAQEAARAAEEAAKAKAEAETQASAKAAIEAAEEAAKPIYPSKYLRLLSSKTGCGPCIHQDQILMGSDWIIHDGNEEQNKDKRPYHGLKQEVESLRDANNPLWAKYKAKIVPFWQLVEDGKVVKTHSGVLTLNQLRDFYLTASSEKHNNSDCTCENCKCGANCQCGR